MNHKAAWLRSSLVISLILSLILLPGSIALAQPRQAAFSPSPSVQALINQVSASQVMTYVSILSGEQPVLIGLNPYTFTTRNTLNEASIQKAVQYGYEHFQSLGLQVTLFDYTYMGTGTRQDVIAEQPGQTDPGCVYLVGAHVDDMPPVGRAPGADDNASGAAGVLAAADILSQVHFACTLRYALFSGEEEGLLGSSAYAFHLNSQGENIRAMINLDMIGYSQGDQPKIELHTGLPKSQHYSADLELANLFTDVISAYQLNLAPSILPDGITASDHSPFWLVGFPAILAIEAWTTNHTPEYHKSSDLLSTLNPVFFTQYVKAAVGTLAHLASMSESLTGQVINQGIGIPLAGMRVEAQLGTDSWWTLTGKDGRYQLLLQPETYTVTASFGDLLKDSQPGISLSTGKQLTLNFTLAARVIFLPAVRK
jgi:hypothetical protein